MSACRPFGTHTRHHLDIAASQQCREVGLGQAAARGGEGHGRAAALPVTATSRASGSVAMASAWIAAIIPVPTIPKPRFTGVPSWLLFVVAPVNSSGFMRRSGAVRAGRAADAARSRSRSVRVNVQSNGVAVAL